MEGIAQYVNNKLRTIEPSIARVLNCTITISDRQGFCYIASHRSKYLSPYASSDSEFVKMRNDRRAWLPRPQRKRNNVQVGRCLRWNRMENNNGKYRKDNREITLWSHDTKRNKYDYTSTDVSRCLSWDHSNCNKKTRDSVEKLKVITQAYCLLKGAEYYHTYCDEDTISRNTRHCQKCLHCGSENYRWNWDPHEWSGWPNTDPGILKELPLRQWGRRYLGGCSHVNTGFRYEKCYIGRFCCETCSKMYKWNTIPAKPFIIIRDLHIK